MSNLQLVVRWTDGINGDTVTLVDVLSVDIKRGKEAKHNTADIILQNNIKDDPAYYQDGEIVFEAEDPIDIYVKYGGTAIDTTSTDDLIFSGRVVEYKVDTSDSKTPLKLMLSDSSFVALNKLWVGQETDTPPNLIVNQLIPWVNDTIQDPRNHITATFGASSVQNTPSVAGSYDDYTMTQVFKPVYEIISELSQPNNTGDGDRAYKFHIDKNNVFRWFYPEDSAQHYIVEGSIAANGSVPYKQPVTNATETVNDTNPHRITSLKLKKAVYDTTNFIIYKAGEDLNNVQILDFAFDPTSGAPITKDSFRNWEDIARTLKKGEEAVGNITLDKSDEYTINNPTGTTYWGESYSGTSDYNEKFINYAKKLADGRCQAEFEKRGNPRFKGTIELKGENNFDVNEAFILQARSHGIQKGFFRINSVKHNIRKSGWFTTLDVEEEIQKEFTT